MASWQTYFAFHKHVHVTVHIHQLIPALSSNVILRGGNASKRELRRKAKHPGHTRPTNRDQGPNRTQRNPHGPDQAAHDTPSRAGPSPAPATNPITAPAPHPAAGHRKSPQDLAQTSAAQQVPRYHLRVASRTGRLYNGAAIEECGITLRKTVYPYRLTPECTMSPQPNHGPSPALGRRTQEEPARQRPNTRSPTSPEISPEGGLPHRSAL